MDVVNAAKIKNKLQNRKRNGHLNNLMDPSEDPGQNSGIDESAPGNAGSQRFKTNNNAASRGNDYL